jgi:hypothetical protein
MCTGTIQQFIRPPKPSDPVMQIRRVTSSDTIPTESRASKSPSASPAQHIKTTNHPSDHARTQHRTSVHSGHHASASSPARTWPHPCSLLKRREASCLHSSIESPGNSCNKQTQPIPPAASQEISRAPTWVHWQCIPQVPSPTHHSMWCHQTEIRKILRNIARAPHQRNVGRVNQAPHYSAPSNVHRCTSPLCCMLPPRLKKARHLPCPKRVGTLLNNTTRRRKLRDDFIACCCFVFCSSSTN